MLCHNFFSNFSSFIFGNILCGISKRLRRTKNSSPSVCKRHEVEAR